jgi:site-specific DNA recombinase
MMEKLKQYNVAIYCRISVEDGTNNESLSISHQKDLLTQYVQNQGWPLFQIYIDDGYSGTNFERPAFKRMISNIENGSVNLVIVKDLSRLGRNYILCGQYIEIYFVDKKVRFIALNDGVDSIRDNNDIAPFKNILNDMYCRDMSFKIKNSFKQKVAKSEYLGGRAPIGYIRNPKNYNQLIIDDEVANIIKRIFDLCINGNAPNQIADCLNQEQILTPSDYFKFCRYDFNMSGTFEPKTVWSKDIVKCILKNQVYIGNLVQGKRQTKSYRNKALTKNSKASWVIAENTHQPIVSNEIFNKAQQYLKIRNLSISGPDNDYLLHGLIYCDDCCSSMGIHYRSNYSYYVCNNFLKDKKGCCSSHYISCKDINDIVQSNLRKNLMIFAEDWESAIKKLKEANNHQTIDRLYKLKLELDQTIIRQNNLQQKINRLYEDNLSKKLPEHIFNMLMTGYNADYTKLSDQIAKLTVEIEEMQNCCNRVSNFAELINKHVNYQTLDRYIINELIDKITIACSPTDDDTKPHKIIRIYYKFVGIINFEKLG